MECIVSWFYHDDYDDSRPSERDIPDYSLKLGVHLAFVASDLDLEELENAARRRAARHLQRMSNDGTFFEVLSILQKNISPKLAPKHHFSIGMVVLKRLEKLDDRPILDKDAIALLNNLFRLYAHDTRDLILGLAHVR